MSDQEPTEVTPPSPKPEPPQEPEAEPTNEPEPTTEPVSEPTEPEPEPEPKPAPEPEDRAEAPTPGAAPAPARPRRLERSQDDRVIAGVCGGLGEYLGVDPVLIRIAALILVFAGGAGLLLYAIGWIAIPESPDTGIPGPLQSPRAPAASERTGSAVAIGVLFVVLGAFFLVDEIWSDFLAWKYIWPIALIAVGAVVLLRARQ